MFPKLSAPLTKAIRTSEGIAFWAVNAAIGIAASVPAAQLSVKDAAILASINAGGLTVSRILLKVTAISKGVGLAPINFEPLPFAPQASGLIASAVSTAIGDVAQNTSGKAPSLHTVADEIDALAQKAGEVAPLLPGPAGKDISEVVSAVETAVSAAPEPPAAA